MSDLKDTDMKQCTLFEDEIKTVASWLKAYRRRLIQEFKGKDSFHGVCDDTDLDEIARVKQFIEERLGEKW